MEGCSKPPTHCLSTHTEKTTVGTEKFGFSGHSLTLERPPGRWGSHEQRWETVYSCVAALKKKKNLRIAL